MREVIYINMAKHYPIRKLTSCKGEDYFGITIPKEMAQNNSGAKFTIEQCGPDIVLRSGCVNQKSMYEVCK